jgi:DNA-binding transcriptional regulator LsrR (DeoR family)
MVEQKDTRRRAAIPVAFGGNPVVWAAWLYYEEGMTQDEIARQIGVSRASINNLLQAARDEGVVTISVSAAHLSTVTLARQVRDRFGIAECLVIPEDGGRRANHERVGEAGARLLAERLQPDDVLGVSWGRTVLALSKALAPKQLPGVSVVQVTGSAIGTYRFSAEMCASNIANRIGGRCIYLHAPGIVSRPAVKRVLMREPTLVEQFRIIERCNRIVFGVGSVATSSTAFESGFLTPQEARPYIARGAVAVLAGRFVDPEGHAVHGTLDERLIGIGLDALKTIPDRICVAAGIEKTAAVRAMLTGAYVTTLVTDQATASRLLGEDD